MQTQQLSQQLSQAQSDLSQSDQSHLSEVNSDQLQNTLKTLKKFKLIEKQNKLQHFKEKNKVAHQIFKEMSSYFFKNRDKKKDRQKLKAKEAKTTKKQRIQAKKAQKTQVSICKLKRFRYKQTKKSLNKLLSHLDQEIQIEQQPQNQQNLTQELLDKKCHICRVPITKQHHFYKRLCSQCAELNFLKRTQKVNLNGLTALVTGGRIKIGYQIAVKLLRDGAKVYVTSRFANDTLLRYQKEQDYQLWKANLYILQCDFLSQRQVDELISYIKQNVPKLDILINNAAQTIVRPKQFYSIELQKEKLTIQYPNPVNSNQIVIQSNNTEVAKFPSLYSNDILAKPDQIDLTKLDQFGQPTDKRTSNSWVQRIQDVSLLDCYTTQVVNSIVPFHLISQLRQTMKGDTPSWIINVSSMEGVFYRPGKQQYHPHTNMAKAALNMITRTCAHQFLRDGIYMNSVDTGWVTNQNPLLLAQKMKDKYKFQCPLDCIDGAMRVIDPIYLGIARKQFPVGQFIKNYASSLW